jgi:hypothetical protein
MEKQVAIFLLLIWRSIASPVFLEAQGSKIWTLALANSWQDGQPWIVGCNFIPSTAINELEMWQKETFDSVTIDRELSWAHQLGMNTVRVFLHNIPWQEDSEGFKGRINQFLDIADRNQIKSMFVLFDDCWNDDPRPGKQPDPRPGVHNSGWVQCPGRSMHNDSSTWGILESYVKDILTAFGKDQRIRIWDLYNEPGNGNYGDGSFALLRRVFDWAWSVRPVQPLTAGIWYDNQLFNNWQTSHSDIISFHNYNDAVNLEAEIRSLEKKGRPLICSEYMARTRNSRFQTHLPVFKKYKVGAINWGFVSGKTNTIYQWEKPVPDGSEPKIWFHDIYRKDGTPFDEQEVGFFKEITGSK